MIGVLSLYTRHMRRFLFTIGQLTWGLPQTLVGAAVYASTAGCPRFRFRGALGTVWKAKSSVSLGLFVFVAKDPRTPRSDRFVQERAATAGADPRLVVHEYGHCIQSLIFGPFYLLVIGAPSFIWAMMPYMHRRRIKYDTSYYSLYTERLANYLGERVTHMPSLR